MSKFFVASNQIYDDKIEINGEDVNHIVNVLRMKIGEQIYICDYENGQNYLANINDYTKDKVLCTIAKKVENKAESNVCITIFQGLPKFDKMELIIQKATEIGVKKIVPVSMKRSIVKLNGKEEKKVERWRKIAEIASKQSMRDIIPKVENIVTLKDIENNIKDFDMFLVAYEDEKNNTLKAELKNYYKNHNIAILIGPEGGIDQTEIEILKKYDNVKIITLGNRILRTETAGLVMASNIIYELEN